MRTLGVWQRKDKTCRFVQKNDSFLRNGYPIMFKSVEYAEDEETQTCRDTVYSEKQQCEGKKENPNDRIWNSLNIPILFLPKHQNVVFVSFLHKNAKLWHKNRKNGGHIH